MEAYQHKHYRGYDPDVEAVEPQGPVVEARPCQKGLHDRVNRLRHPQHDVLGLHGPVVEDQGVAGEGENNRYDPQEDPGDPEEVKPPLVEPLEEDVDGVDDREQHHPVGCVVMNPPEEVAEGDVLGQEPDGVVGHVPRRWLVVEKQGQTRNTGYGEA